MSKVWEHTLDEYEKSIKSSDTRGAAILRALLLPQLERPSAKVDHVPVVATVEPTYTVLENNPGEWIIVKVSDFSFLWSERGWVRAGDGVYILNFPSEAAALTFAQQHPALHLPANEIPAPWKDWPTEHLLRKIAMPEGFVAELRTRLKHPDTNCAFCGKNLTECECPQPL